MLRTESRRGEALTDSVEDGADTATLEDAFLKSERDKAIHSAISSLKADYRDVLNLLYFHNASYRDAALIMHKSVKQITNLSHRAKAALKNSLKEKGYDYENR